MTDLNVALVLKLKDRLTRQTGKAARMLDRLGKRTKAVERAARKLGDDKRLAQNLHSAGDKANRLKNTLERGRDVLWRSANQAERLARAEHRAKRNADRVNRSYEYRERLQKKLLDRARRVRDRRMETAGKVGIAGAAGIGGGLLTKRLVGGLLGARVPVERAAGELATLGMSEEGIQKIIERGLALQGKIAIPELAAKFVAAAYDVKSGISSLDDQGVASTTAAVAFTARATKAQLENLASLFATGHGIFKDKFANLSDGAFSERFAASLAKSVQQFKTTGAKMQQAIESATAGPSNIGMSMAEEFAVLGMLQKKMPGGEAGTALKSFAANAAKAHEEFAGLAKGKNKSLVKILDPEGRLRPMADILADITKRYGEINAFESAEIKKAFGTEEAVKLIDPLQGRDKALRQNIASVKAAGEEGLAFVERMAMVREKRLDARLQRIANKMNKLAQRLVEAMVPAIEKVTDAIEKLLDLMTGFVESNKTLAKWIGIVVVGAGALATAFGGGLVTLATLIGGHFLLRSILAKFGIQMITATGLVGMLFGKLKGITRIFGPIGRAIGFVARTLAFLGALALAHPVIALIAAIAAGAFLIYDNWERVGPFLGDLWEGVKTKWSGFKDWFTSYFESLPGIVQKAVGLIAAAIKNMPAIGHVYRGLEWLLSDDNPAKPKLQNLLGTQSATPPAAARNRMQALRRQPTDLAALKAAKVDQSTRVDMKQSNTITVQVRTDANPNEIARKIGSAIGRATSSALHDGVPK